MKIRPNLSFTIFSELLFFVLALGGTIMICHFCFTNISLLLCLLFLVGMPVWIFFFILLYIICFYYIIIEKDYIYKHSIFKKKRLTIYRKAIKNINAEYRYIGRPLSPMLMGITIFYFDNTIKKTSITFYFNAGKMIKTLIDNNYKIDNYTGFYNKN